MAPKPLLDMSDAEWAIVRHILQKNMPDHEVRAFGSRARWAAKPFLDLDLAVIGHAAMPLGLSAALAEDFAESDLPWKVDVLDWATTSPSFQKIIEQGRVVVQRPVGDEAPIRLSRPGISSPGAAVPAFGVRLPATASQPTGSRPHSRSQGRGCCRAARAAPDR
jgi:predicted nucleotidyltransferase